jgi:3-hydroxy-3-methylglutaryl CoA synthase
MQSKKKQSKRVSKVVYRAIKATPQAENADAGGAGRAAQEAVAAAALHQLNRYAADIEQFLQASKMRTLLDRLQAEIAPPVADQPPRMRLRAD